MIVSMKKKWDNISELIENINIDDDTLLRKCEEGIIRKVTYAPNIGYRCWIFRYKGTPVCLWDMGNGHYSFYSAVSWIDILVAKIHCRFVDGLRSGL